MDQQLQNWKFENRRNITQRLAWVRNKEDGIVLFHDDGIEQILVLKDNDLIFLHFVEEDPQTKKDVVSDVMSLIDTANPLVLHSFYAQAMFLPLLFVPEPTQLYMLGFGGGRIPMVLHHYLPDLIIQSSEQSKGVVDLLEMCFGIKTNERLNISTIDGKQHLQSFSSHYFDIILLDSFSGAGMHPNDLSSVEFYKLCQSRLSPQGIVATNLVSTSPYFDQKVEHFCASFRYIYSFNHVVDGNPDLNAENTENINNDNHVYFGSNSHDITKQELIHRAQCIDDQYNFDFKLKKSALMTEKQTSLL